MHRIFTGMHIIYEFNYVRICCIFSLFHIRGKLDFTLFAYGRIGFYISFDGHIVVVLLLAWWAMS